LTQSACPTPREIGILIVGLLVALLWPSPLSADTTPTRVEVPISDDAESILGIPLGFTASAWEEQRRLEEAFAAALKTERIARTLDALSAGPHRTGTEGGRRVALHVLKTVENAGFEAEVVTYLFYNSHPGPRSIQMTAPEKHRLSLAEDRIPGDPFTDATSDHLGFNAYSGSGTVEGNVVYVGQGTWHDFQTLEKHGISLRGRIALMRYFGAGEGAKVLRAQERGAVAAVLYADPREDGFVHGPVYPYGNWRPEGAIMRRSVIGTPYGGDPLTPGWAARPDARRLDPQDVSGLPRIPVLPISYRDAAIVLSHLRGARVPREMQGGIERDGRPLDYHFGPGPARLRLSVTMKNRTDTIRNIIVRIPGKEEPNAWVILSNHHDAWIYGAGDPSSGTAADLEILKVLGDLKRKGWRPRRTLIFAFWDAEEMNLGGSTEWAEEHADELRRKGVAVINMDSAVFNGERPLYVGASPCLHRLFREVAAEVASPAGKGSLSDRWRELQNAMRGMGSVDGFSADYAPSRRFDEPYIDPIPLGDDQTPFVEFLSLPGSDMYYGADYGMYHSLYENSHWMRTVVDPGFRHHRAMAEFHGRLGLRLVMAPMLPLDAVGTADAWHAALSALERRAEQKGVALRIFKPARRSLRRFRQAAREFAEVRDLALTSEEWLSPEAPARLVAVNRQIAAVERSFFEADGLPGYPLSRNLWAASPSPVPGLADARLPGLRWPLEQGREASLAIHAEIYGLALDEATAHLHRAQGILETLIGPPPEGVAAGQ
jgi:N-acetylated-alpha-linked acidic dipeptidase